MLKTRSLRFWITTSMLIALVPLLLSAVGGFVLLNHGVVASFQDVVYRQRNQVIPAQRLRLLIWDTLISVDEYVEEGNPLHPVAYRSLRTRIESKFASLDEVMTGDPAARTHVQTARDEWTSADRYATELFSVPMQPGDARRAETLQRFHGKITAASDRLSAVVNQIDGVIEADHDTAVLFFERSKWLTGIAAAISLLSIAFGVVLIGRIMTSSVDRLVQGAVRFSEGDRNHRIEVSVPAELHRVAEEFNHMIGRIHESEALLSELAHRDGLTGLSNRRAFDEALPEMWARVQRFDEQSALLAIDIDHFKRTNDTHGHAAGDAVLRAVAKTITGSLRPFDKVFRTGGEEFAVLMPKTDRVAARESAERLRQAIAGSQIGFKDAKISATVSIGIASTVGIIDQSTLVEMADAALYRAKAEGRNRIVSSGEDQQVIAMPTDRRLVMAAN